MADYDPAAPGMDEDMQNGDDQYNPQADGDDDDDYDPSSFDIGGDAPAEQASADAAKHEAPKQKTIGGFLVEDEDEEEDAAQPPPSQLNGIEGAQSGLGAAAVAQAQDVPPVASEPSQDLAAQTAGLNGPAQPSVVSASPTPSNVSTTAPSFQPPAPAPQSAPAEPLAEQQGKQELQQQANTEAAASVSQSVAPTPQPPQTATVAPQSNANVPAAPTTARLPHDKVGQLEDRIKEDPRADTEAWMSLIAHYKERSQYDQMRSVYDRFFSVFPDAVRASNLSRSNSARGQDTFNFTLLPC